WSTGDGLVHGLERGAALSTGMAEFYGRNMSDTPWTEPEYVAAAQLYARRARIFDEDGVEFFQAADVIWSETNVVQAAARRRGRPADGRRTRGFGCRVARRPADRAAKAAVHRAARHGDGGARRRLDHAHDRRPARRRARTRRARRRKPRRGPLRRGRRCRRSR